MKLYVRIGLFVSVVHRDYQCGSDVFNRNFPYYTFSRGREDLVLPSLRRDQTLRVIPRLMAVVQMQTRVIHQECASVQPDTTPLIEDMQNRVTAANALLKSADSEKRLILKTCRPSSP